MTVFDLKLAPIEPVPEVVGLFEDLLAKAKAGHIRGAGVAVATCDRCYATVFELGDATLAEVGWASAELQKRLLETS